MTLQVNLGLQDRLAVIAVKRNRDTKVYTSANIITDVGLEVLKTTTVSLLANYCGLGSNPTTPTAGDLGMGSPGDPLVQATNVYGDPCSGTHNQDSTLEGWSVDNGGVVDTFSLAGDFSWAQMVRHRKFTDTSFDFNHVTTFGDGGVQLGLRDIYFAKSISRPSNNVNCPPVVSWFYHVIDTMWNRTLFKSAGVPVAVDVDPGTELDVVYTMRLLIPITELVQVVDGITMRTRAYRADQIGRWNPVSLGTWSGNPALFRAWESNTMPALDANMTGSNVAAYSIESTPGGAGLKHMDQRLVWNAAVANFPTGIGAVTHYSLDSANPSLVTTFTPKLTTKTNVRKFVFDVRYAWDRVAGGD